MGLLNLPLFITWHSAVITNSLTTPPVFATLRRGIHPLEGNLLCDYIPLPRHAMRVTPSLSEWDFLLFFTYGLEMGFVVNYM